MPTAADLAADIRRQLARKPVVARCPTLGYRAKCLVKRNGSRLVTSAAVVIVLAGVLFAFWARSQQNAGEATAITRKSIAVLPFENLSSDPDNAYFAEAIQDEILARLSKIADSESDLTHFHREIQKRTRQSARDREATRGCKHP